MTKSAAIVLFVLLSLVCVPTLFAIDTLDTCLLTQPAAGKDRIAFIYGGDLWTAQWDGQRPRRLTSHPGPESNPVFSPDGRLIAFNADYDGNTDVYVVSVDGGVPQRLTWHPGTDTVHGWTPDGRSVLFSSARAVFTNRYTQLYLVDASGGFAQALQIPYASRASYSPDGARIAYNPLSDAFTQWKHYRGGRASTISIFKIADNSIEKIPQPEGRCNDVQPLWAGDTIYFRSDRSGEFNLFSYDTKTKAIKQITNHTDFPIVGFSVGGQKIVYEQAGYLHSLEVGKAKAERIAIGVAADLMELRPRFVKGDRYLRDVELSPSGARAAIEFRGEILSIPAEKGDPRNLTNTSSAHERYPAWSPNGKSIAYFSDESGEYELHIKNQDGKGEVRKLKVAGAGFYENPEWSPDGLKISYTDNSRSLYWIDVTSGTSKKVGSEYLYSPSGFKSVRHVWSPDSKWIAYTLNGKSYFDTIYAYSVEQDKSYPITDGLSDVSEPAFDASGKYLFFLASTDAGPQNHWFDMSNVDTRTTSSIYLAVLRSDLPSPLAKESDEEKGDQKEEKPNPDAEKAAKASADAKKDKEDPAKDFKIDFDGINFRIVALPVPPGEYSQLRTGAAGQVYYLETLPAVREQGGGPRGGRFALHHYDLSKRKDETIISRLDRYQLSRDNKKVGYSAGGAVFITELAAKVEPGKGKVNLDAVEVRIDPANEWEQIFNEVWRINRDYFYDPNMHGVDWKAMRNKYAAFLPHVTNRDDLNRVLTWMCSELAVGHHRVGGGDGIYQPKSVPGGLLGADYEIANGRYRFKKVYGGLNWSPDLQSPLTAPGVNVKAGEYLLGVQGVELRTPTNLYSVFENTAGKLIEITVGPNPDGSGSRTVPVVPIENESALRNRDWVEGNLRKVDAATGGRVAYVYVPNTANLGHTYFKRYFFPQSHKDAVIVDERFNGGGSVADYYIDVLRRPLISYWAMRYGADLKTPSASIQGPKVMLIDETAGSGGDLLPWMFRKFQLGKLIGKRTWGGLVGILGFPVLMDGGFVTAPNLAIWTEDGWVVENEGVPPDIEVEQTPADVIAGRDPQLEKAIQVVLDELKKNPPKQPVRPPYPNKTVPPNTTRVEKKQAAK